MGSEMCIRDRCMLELARHKKIVPLPVERPMLVDHVVDHPKSEATSRALALLPYPGSSVHEMPVGLDIPQALARTLFLPLRDVPPPELRFVEHERAPPRSLAPSACD